ncbi:MAG: hypothetical protein UV38_C0003G0107 [candidate division TM6 bacterium GW2011_GWE2_42_60]|nr:MAG: hypothetical protein UV38_C0003G0107 [candidate division TM6 bacterium GW2011_GWE2_42_60]HBY05414.1 hypothetical protein [Candidatus Dependentiae bacterium]
MNTLKQLLFSIIAMATFIHTAPLSAAYSSSRMVNLVEQNNLPELKRIIKNHKEKQGTIAYFLPITMEINCKGETPLHRASQHGFIDIAEYLISQGADVNAQDEHLKTPIFDALNYPEFVKLLLKHGAKINAKHEDGSTPLHYALTLDSHPHAPKLLIDSGADIYARDNDGYTPLSCAFLNKKNNAIVQIIIETMIKDGISLNTLSTHDRQKLVQCIIPLKPETITNSLVVQALLFALMQKKPTNTNKKTFYTTIKSALLACLPQQRTPDQLPENRILITVFERAIKQFRQLPIYERILMTPHLKNRFAQLKIAVDTSDKPLTRDMQYFYNNFDTCIALMKKFKNKNCKKVPSRDLKIIFKQS